jgi:beta-galactosidase
VGLEFKSDDLFNFNVYPFSTDNMTRARYPYQLENTHGNTLNIDYATSGVGCTAISVLDKYRVLPGVYNFRMTIKPFKTN